MANKFAAAIAAAAEHDNYNEAEGFDDFPILPEGPVRLRFVGYVELGQEPGEWKGKKKINDKVKFIFEVTGPKIEPRNDGLAHTISFNLNKPERISEKSNFYKLFRKMNYEDKYKVFAEMLGQAFRGQIVHNKSADGTKTYANLNDADGNYLIAPPWFDDPESGERKLLKIAEPVSPIKCFLWNYPDKEQWDSLFIDGEYEAKDGQPARSKNYLQNRIKEALNWVGSPMQEALFGDIDIGDVEKPDRKADIDPLADDDIPF